MIVSESKSFIYARIPKTGSTSVSLALEPYRRAQDKSRIGALVRAVIPTLRKSFAVNFRAHPHWPLRAARDILPSSFFNSATKFTVVRDPLSWCISLHNHILRNKDIPRYAKLYQDVYENTSFDYFASTLPEKPIPPQAGMVADSNGRIMADYVVRLENLDSEIQVVFERLGIATVVNQLNKGNYKAVRSVSSESIEIINAVYGIDYSTFGYSECGSPTTHARLDVTLKSLGNWLETFDPLDYYPFMREQNYASRPESQRWFRL